MTSNPYGPEAQGAAAQNPYAPPTAPVNPYAPPGQVKPPPLWNPDAAGAWSLFLSPVFGSVLLYRNIKALGLESQQGTAIAWIVFSVIMLIPTMLLPGVGLIWIIVWYFAWQRKQSRLVRERWGKNYPKKGWIVPILIALVSLFAFGFLLSLLTMAGGAAGA